MVRLTEDMIVGRTRVSDLASVRKLNCWGADLTDITVLQLLDQVEVLSLSVNNITSLEDVQNCRNLQELFVRKNNIQDLSEILWLKPLRKLSSLMLSENPCSDGNGLYRHTVLRTLPQLRKLDNQDVTPEEMAQAMRLGRDLEAEEVRRPRSPSPAYYEGPGPGYPVVEQPAYWQEDAFRSPPDYMEPVGPAVDNRRYSRSSEDLPPPCYPAPAYPGPQHRASWAPRASYLHRPKNRNSNMLSAILCLIKEIDGPSLEVVEMAARCRMGELDD